MSEQQSRLGSVADIDLIVDADAHIREGPDELAPYLDEPWSRIYGGTDDPKKDTIRVPEVEYPGSLGGKIQTDEAPPTAADKREIQERYGMDYLVITSGALARMTPVLSDDRYAHAIAKAYNDYLIEEFLEKGYDGFKGLAMLSPQHSEKAVEEIERVTDHPDIVGVLMGSTGIFPPLGHRRYDPIYEALERRDLPLVLHPQKAGLQETAPMIKRGCKTWWEFHVIAHPFSQMIQLTSLVGQGFPERFPDATLVFQEAGIGWIPYTMYRMDAEYEKRRADVPLLEKRPSEYITNEGTFYFTSQPLAETRDTTHVAQLVEMMNGSETLMFSSDHPHYDEDSPEETFDLIGRHLDAQTVRNIFGETAEAVFDLG